MWRESPLPAHTYQNKSVCQSQRSGLDCKTSGCTTRSHCNYTQHQVHVTVCFNMHHKTDLGDLFGNGILLISVRCLSPNALVTQSASTWKLKTSIKHYPSAIMGACPATRCSGRRAQSTKTASDRHEKTRVCNCASLHYQTALLHSGLRQCAEQ